MKKHKRLIRWKQLSTRRWRCSRPALRTSRPSVVIAAAISCLILCAGCPGGPRESICGEGDGSDPLSCCDGLSRQPANVYKFRASARWPRTTLTWTGTGTPELDEDAQFDAAVLAFQRWASVSKLTFRFVETEPADITITFEGGLHGDPLRFNDSCKPLAHAFFPGTPRVGQVHLCEDADWRVGPNGLSACTVDPLACAVIHGYGDDEEHAVDLYAILLHEIGHAIGLEHTLDSRSIMSFVCPNPDASDLSNDDIAAIRRLYGSEDGTIEPEPLPDPDNLPEPPDLSDLDDPDSDGDQIPDMVEILQLGTDWSASDNDADGTDDYTEVFEDGTDPNYPGGDGDRDGLPDQQEEEIGTDPDDPDTDRDGLPDGVETLFGTDPLDPDTDGDGIIDGKDPYPLVCDDCQHCQVGPDCNDNGVRDQCDISNETSEDCNYNFRPDECDPDSNGNGVPDDCELLEPIEPVCVPEHCDDGDPCTTDSCEDTGCRNIPTLCNDDRPCTTDSCDSETGDCVFAPVECPPGQECDPPTGECADAPPCETDEKCDDGDTCTTDTCEDGECVFTVIVCEAGVCIEGECVPVPCETDAVCDDGVFCNGAETCSAEGTCEPGDPPCPDDGLFCDGVEACDEDVGACFSTGDPCDEGFACQEDTDECIEGEPCTTHAECDDGVFCNGVETCDEDTDMCQAPGPPCDPVGEFCDEENDACSISGVDCAPGLSFTLAQDTLIGSLASDIFCAPRVLDVDTGVLVPSLQTGDSADGGVEGPDILFASLGFAEETTVVPTLSNFALVSFADFGAAPTTIDGVNSTNVTSVRSWGSTNTNALTISNLDTLILTGLADTASGLTLSFTASATAGNSNAMDLSSSNVSGGTVTILSSGTNGIETLNITASGAGNTFDQITQGGTGNTLGTIVITGTVDFTILTALDNSVTAVDASAATGDVTLTVSAGSDIVGGPGNDTLGGSSGADAIFSGMGNDTVRPGRGIDLVDVGAGNDFLALDDLTPFQLISSNRVRVSNMTIDGSGGDALGFANVTDNGDLSNGASASEFQTSTTPGNQTLNSTAAILELNWAFDDIWDLDDATDGSLLLLNIGGTITADEAGDAILIIAYQGSSAYIYFGDTNSLDANITADEIRLVVVIDGGVTTGGFDASNFQ